MLPPNAQFGGPVATPFVVTFTGPVGDRYDDIVDDLYAFLKARGFFPSFTDDDGFSPVPVLIFSTATLDLDPQLPQVLATDARRPRRRRRVDRLRLCSLDGTFAERN